MNPVVGICSIQARRASECVSIVTHSLARFEVAPFMTVIDQTGENTVNYQNPKRQRGILANAAETQNCNPSLTQRVVMAATAQLQNWRVGLVGLVSIGHE